MAGAMSDPSTVIASKAGTACRRASPSYAPAGIRDEQANDVGREHGLDGDPRHVDPGRADAGVVLRQSLGARARVLGDRAGVKGRHALEGLLEQAFSRDRSEIAGRRGSSRARASSPLTVGASARPKGEGVRLLDQQKPLAPPVHRQLEAQPQQRNRRHLRHRRRRPCADAAELVLPYRVERSFDQRLGKDGREGVTARDERSADGAGSTKAIRIESLRPRAADRSRKAAGRCARWA